MVVHDPDRLLIDARLLRRCAKVLTSYDDRDNISNELRRIADQLQNQACGFEEQAQYNDYDTPPIERERRKEEPPPLED